MPEWFNQTLTSSISNQQLATGSDLTANISVDNTQSTAAVTIAWSSSHGPEGNMTIQAGSLEVIGEAVMRSFSVSGSSFTSTILISYPHFIRAIAFNKVVIE